MEKESKILYVDDEAINLYLFKVVFKNNYNVLTADCGAQALDILNESSDISLVISDMNMPNMSGLEFVAQAKLKYPNLKFYILTGYGKTKEIQEALNSKQIVKYFSKPFDKDEIESELDSNI